MLLFTNFTTSLPAAPSDHNDAPYQQLGPPKYLQPFLSHFLHIFAWPAPRAVMARRPVADQGAQGQ